MNDTKKPIGKDQGDLLGAPLSGPKGQGLGPLTMEELGC